MYSWRKKHLQQYYLVCYTLHIAETLQGNTGTDSHTTEVVLQQLQFQMRSLQTTRWRAREVRKACSLSATKFTVDITGQYMRFPIKVLSFSTFLQNHLIFFVIFLSAVLCA